MRPKIDVTERVKKLEIWKGREQGLSSFKTPEKYTMQKKIIHHIKLAIHV
jgi:hypothetical protein